MRINQISINGEKQIPVITNESSQDIIELSESYTISSASRGFTASHTIDLQDGKLLELIFEDTTTWLCNGDTLEEVFPEVTMQNRSVAGTFQLPATLQSTEAHRGVVSDIALKVVNVFTKKVVGKEVREIAIDLEKKQLEHFSGLYRLDPGFQFQNFEPSGSKAPYLLFLHGTASSTKGSFGELINTDLWNYIHQTYGTQVLAFQHETLTKSPLQNVLELVKAFPANITLDIISHSRGGLLGDLLCRFSNADENNRGFDADELDYLKKVNRQDDLRNIDLIKKELQNKKIVVNKFIRVACPAGGTTLASKRLDGFFNITLNLVGYGTGIAANPIYAAFKSLIAAVIDSKNNVDVLPGLEAMNPDSAFIKVLNSPNTKAAVDHPLIVVSGNCKAKPDLKALLIIASKLFYLKDNDLVVNTRSMYQGTRRLTPVQYFFDEAADVDHFHYFKNKETNSALLNALKAVNGQIPGFTVAAQTAILDQQRNALLNLDGGQVFANTVTGSRPIVVLLPGIMGSNLSLAGSLLWINYFRFIEGGLTQLTVAKNGISAPSLIKTSYKKLVEYLADTYDVVTFPYDWRLPLPASAALFNNRINELLKYRQPVKIIGHSMGGVLVRDFIINHPDTWHALRQTPGFKLVFLGAPLGGSYRIPAVLFGKDVIINKLAKIDIFHTKKELVNLFANMPGILNLLPLNNEGPNDFSAVATWTAMREALGIGDWPIPQGDALAEFEKYRDAIQQKVDNIDYSDCIYIAGKDTATPCGYRIDDTSTGKELVFLSTAAGDQSVTWESGIPKKMVEKNQVYYVDVTHGSLANEPAIFDGIKDILANGTTALLSKIRPTVRGEETVFRMPDPHDFDLSPDGIETTLLALGDSKAATVSKTPIQVSVCHGDLRYASYPLLASHFLNDGITSTEAVLDRKLKGTLSKRHRLGIYPGDIGSSEVIVYQEGGWKGAIVVGLGPFGELSDYQLTKTTEQGICRFLLDINNQVLFQNDTVHTAGPIGISTLVIGSGYGGLTIESSIRAIIQGVQNANDKIKKLELENPRLIEQVEFIELYEDRALNCFYSLSKMEKEPTSILNIIVSHQIRTLLGAKKRIPVETMEGWWTRITIQMIPKTEASDQLSYLQFNISTGGARDEQQKLYINPAGLNNLISNSAANNRWSPTLAKTLFERLIPLNFKERLKKQCNIIWIIDKYTASYPWELLQDNITDARPLSVNAGMIRQLSTQDYRLAITTVVSDTALVIADPKLNGFITQLTGALEEGKLVSDLLSKNGFTTTPVLNSTSPDILQKLFSNDYKIIHLAGHGLFNEKSPQESGMVIGKGEYLTTFDIAQMSTVPELVFVNCCYLGQTDGVAEELYQNRYRLAANIGTQLIENGVKAVVVAGWAVNDAAALDFTTVFYQHMFNGYTFGGAIQEARKTIYDKYSKDNTWGAYQCYGDPFYRFRSIPAADTSYHPEFVIAEEAEIEMDNLRNELKTGRYTPEENVARVSAISNAVDKAGLRNAAITEKEALIFADLYDYDSAIARFESLLTMEKAAFTVSTLEKYCNVRSKKYVYDFIQLQKRPNDVLTRINRVIKELELLLAMGITAERYSLLGSACKRKAIFSTNTSQKLKAYADAAYYYMKADAIQYNTYAAYTATNWYELESILVYADDRRWGETVTHGNETYTLPAKEEAVKRLNQIVNSLKGVKKDMDYWDMVTVANIKLCLLFIDQETAGNEQNTSEVLNVYANVWKDAGSKGEKFAEIEHLELLIDALALSKNDITPLKKIVSTLKEGLERIVI